MSNPEVVAFIEEVLAVCKRHGLSISHQDDHGAFEIVAYDPFYDEWLRDAIDERGRK